MSYQPVIDDGSNDELEALAANPGQTVVGYVSRSRTSSVPQQADRLCSSTLVFRDIIF
jgi:hypothetical protein